MFERRVPALGASKFAHTATEPGPEGTRLASQTAARMRRRPAGPGLE